MSRVECGVTYDEEDGREYVEVTCGRCGHSVRSWGDSDSSVRRCLVLLREECPEGENNFYIAEDY